MDAQAALFLEKLNKLSFAELRDAALKLYLEKRDISRKYTEMESSSSEMTLQYQQMQGERDAALYEVKQLTLINADLADQNAKLRQMMFGTSSEKSSGLKSQPESSEVTDPLDEDGLQEEPEGTGDPAGSESSDGKESNGDENSKGKGGGTGKTGSNGRKSRRDIFTGMAERVVFEFDIDKYNEEYGEGNWRFGPWHAHDSVIHVKAYSYHQITYTPVLSVGLEHTAVTIPWEGAILPGSYASSSLLAALICEKNGMYLPLYRQEHDPGHFGFELSRQTASNWINNCAMDHLEPVYEYMMQMLRDQEYQQCDETTYHVVQEDGHTQYMWVHCTSELSEDNKIIIYCYDSSRSADHLRRFYAGLDHEIKLTSDAYSAYYTIRTETGGLIINCGCNMHSRRRFSNAMLLLPKEARSDESNPEVRALSLLGEMYGANTPLSSVSPEERAAVRDTLVREKMMAFLDFVHETDMEDPLLSGVMKDALAYTVNHEEDLCRFLDDPFIPADNGFCERSVKAIALIRKNSLFSFSVRGAHATAICCSLIATAKEHGADPYYYIKYLLEKVSSYARKGQLRDWSLYEDLMPWSDVYRAYEKKEKEDLIWQKAPPGNERPRTPRKRAS